ncbi:MAG: lipopolysaccharide transport periplasmic protein LptA [Devosia sp.]
MIARLAPALILALALTGASLAAPAPVEISANEFTVEESAHQATFAGDVVVKRPGMTLWAGKVVVDYGDGGPSNIVSFVATGGVRLQTNDQTAKGDRADYDPKTQILRLTGNVTITNASGTLTGPQLVLNLADNTTTFSAKGGGRVTGVFTPQ